MSNEVIIVPHPDYGWCEFHGMSIRQKEILNDYKNKLKEKDEHNKQSKTAIHVK